jgi:hypothetical protein
MTTLEKLQQMRQSVSALYVNGYVSKAAYSTAVDKLNSDIDKLITDGPFDHNGIPTVYLVDLH